MTSHARARRRWIRPVLAVPVLLAACGLAATTLPAVASTVPIGSAAQAAPGGSATEANLALRNDQILLLSTTWSYLTIDVVNDGPDPVAQGDGPAFTATFTYPFGWSVDDCPPVSDTQCVIEGPASLESGSVHQVERSITAPPHSVGNLTMEIAARPGVVDRTSDHSNDKTWLIFFLQF